MGKEKDNSLSDSSEEQAAKVRKSQTATAIASEIARHGIRYYKAAEGYDKRVYENDA